MSQPLHIVRLILDRRELIRVAARHRLPRSVDDGYLLHAGLAQLFAKGTEPAKVPFHSFATDDTNPRAQTDPDHVCLLAYSSLGEKELNDAMGPSRNALVHTCATIPMPMIARGTRAKFRTRICPVVRTKQVGDRSLRTNKKGRTISREVDAWLVDRFASWQDQPPRDESFPFERRGREWSDRERVYASWLARQLAHDDGAILEPGTRMESFERDRIHRSGDLKVQRAGTMQRPNVVLEGILRVTHEDAFRAVLTRGIGRHRAFGFGMLLLKPA
jgi:CRISPR system Cascade subunit CasE